MQQFTLEYWRDDNWYVGRLVEIPGIFSQGETLEGLKKNIQDAYKMMIEESSSNFVPPKAEKIPVEMNT